MKTILLLVHDDEGQEARLQAALDVTRALGGHLSCIDVTIPPQVIAYADYNVFIAPALIAQQRDLGSANRAQVEARLANEDVPWDWRDTMGIPADAINEGAGLADLIVLSSRLDAPEPSELRNLAGQVARKSARPVLAVPAGSEGLDLRGPALVAWDGSREADEALRQAVPLLRLASEVILLEIDKPDEAFPAEEAARYLSRNDIHATVATAPRETSVPATILARAHAAGATYIVMGAYGHAPIVETAFGGVTRSMLKESDLPLLLAH